MGDNSIRLNDILGNTIDKKNTKTRDKINNSIGRIFNKEFRQNYRQLKHSDQLYRFAGHESYDAGATGNNIEPGETTFDPNTKAIVINYQYGKVSDYQGTGGLQTMYHETTHAVQFDDGKFGFIKEADGNWHVANNDLIDEYEALNSDYLGTNNRFYKNSNGIGGTVRDRTAAGIWQDDDINGRLNTTSDRYPEYHNIRIQKVNANSIKIDNNNNYFRPYNPKSRNPSGSPIKLVDATVPVEIELQPNEFNPWKK